MTDMTNPVPCLRLLGSPYPRATDEQAWFYVGDCGTEGLGTDIGECLLELLVDMQEDEEPFSVTFKAVMLTDKQVEELR